MAYTGRFDHHEDYRREELIRKIEHAVANLTLQKLEALYYDIREVYIGNHVMIGPNTLITTVGHPFTTLVQVFYHKLHNCSYGNVLR